MISSDEQKKLLNLAREAIKSAFEEKEPKVESCIKKKFSEKRGVFVTLKEEEELRGCIGFPRAYYPLWQGIILAARSAAFEDPRFFPLRKDELDRIKIEISVLTVPELIRVKNPEEYLSKIKIGEDGLIIESDFGSGLLLPQVFTEYNCTPEQALIMLCQKAMLPTNAWKDLKNRIYKFQAEVFSD
ncbi:MAG: AmmeMemoRadiSam system protein A [Candidatus Woesearchaeota archaeon]